jgi:hypothetical protein
VHGAQTANLQWNLLACHTAPRGALATWSTVATDGIGSFEPFFDRYYVEAQQRGYAQLTEITSDCLVAVFAEAKP